MAERQAVTKEVARRYHRAPKKLKGVMLTELCVLTGWSRDHARRRLDAMLEAGLVRMFSPRFFEVGAETIDRMLQAFDLNGGDDIASPEVLLAQLDAVDKHNTLAELPAIGVPTLVIGGKMDMMVPYFAQEEIAAAIPGAEFATFETGHGLMIEEMQEFNDHLHSFLAAL